MQAFLKRLLILIALITVIKSATTTVNDENTLKEVETLIEPETAREADANIENEEELPEPVRNKTERVCLWTLAPALMSGFLFQKYAGGFLVSKGITFLHLEFLGIPTTLYIIAAFCFLLPMLKRTRIIKSANIRLGLFLFILYLHNPILYPSKEAAVSILLKSASILFLLFILGEHQKKKAKEKSILSIPQNVRDYICIMSMMLMCFFLHILLSSESADPDNAYPLKLVPLLVMETLLVCLYPMMELITDIKSTSRDTKNAVMVVSPIFLGLIVSFAFTYLNYKNAIALEKKMDKFFLFVAFSGYAFSLFMLMVRNPLKGNRGYVGLKIDMHLTLAMFAYILCFLALCASIPNVCRALHGIA